MRVVILGAGAHGRAIADLLGEGSGLTLVGFTDTDSTLAGQTVLGVPVLGDDGAVVQAVRGGQCDGALVGVGNTAMAARRALGGLLSSAAIPSPVVAYPRATVAASVSVGPPATAGDPSVSEAKVPGASIAACNATMPPKERPTRCRRS